MKGIHFFSNTSDKITTVEKSTGYYVNIDGNTYLDFISGLYNCPLGNFDNSIKKEINNALEQLPNSHLFSIYPGLSQTNIYAENLKNLLQDLIPFGKHIVYTNSGSEAVETAILNCFKQNNKYKVMSYRNSYHGSTMLANQVSGNLNITRTNRIYVDFYDFNSVLSKDEYVRYIENSIIENDPSTISCFIVEPMIGASGGFFMKNNVLPEIKQICEKYNILLVLDEVISGFGRLGDMFAFEKYNVIPDALLLSKQITNGYLPMGVCILSDKFNLDNSDIKMGFTTAGNPMSCAAALSSINLIRETDRSFVESQLGLLANNLIKHNKVFKVEHQGCFLAIHFSKKKEQLEWFDYNIGGELAKLCFMRGLIIRGNLKSAIVAPGYNTTEFQFSSAIKIIMESLDELPTRF